MLTRLLQRKFAIPERLLLDGQNYRELNPDAPVISFTHLEARDPLSALTGSNRLLEGRRVVLLARHPLDVAVSLCHQYRSREWEAKYTALTDASLDEFVRHQVPEIVAFLNRHLRQGSLHAIRLVKYEDLHADPHRALRDLLGFAGLDFSDEEIADAVQFASFRESQETRAEIFLSGRSPPRHRPRRSQQLQGPAREGWGLPGGLATRHLGGDGTLRRGSSVCLIRLYRTGRDHLMRGQTSAAIEDARGDV